MERFARGVERPEVVIDLRGEQVEKKVEEIDVGSSGTEKRLVARRKSIIDQVSRREPA